jgi:hypothetical protein
MDIQTYDANRRMAIFQGIKIVERNGFDAVYRNENAASPEYFKNTVYNTYHKDYNMLMSVFEQIFKTKIGVGNTNICYPYARTWGMINDETGNLMVSINGFQAFEAPTLLEAAYLAVNDFIKQL